GAETASAAKDGRCRRPERAVYEDRNGRRTDPPNTGNEHGDERGDERSRGNTVFSGEFRRPSPTQQSTDRQCPSESRPPRTASRTNPGRARLLNPDWVPGPAEFESAQKLAGWDSERASSEFDQFRSHHKSKGTRSHDWLANWEVWCRNGFKIDERASN